MPPWTIACSVRAKPCTQGRPLRGRSSVLYDLGRVGATGDNVAIEGQMDTDEAHRTAAAGWEYSAQAYIDFQAADDPNRTILLDPAMLEMCGDVRGRRVLDIGCGEGRFCRMLGARGADAVGIDLTQALIRAAHERGGSDGAYLRGSAERLPFADASFDLAISYVTLVDIVDYATAIRESARVLAPGGLFVVANLGFVTASDGWLRAALASGSITASTATPRSGRRSTSGRGCGSSTGIGRCRTTCRRSCRRA